MARVRVSVFPAELVHEALEASFDGRVDIAEQIRDKFGADARVRSGRFKSGVSIRTDGTRVFVENDDPNAFYKEYGTSRSRGQGTLTNAARQFGKYTGFTPRR